MPSSRAAARAMAGSPTGPLYAAKTRRSKRSRCCTTANASRAGCGVPRACTARTAASPVHSAVMRCHAGGSTRTRLRCAKGCVATSVYKANSAASCHCTWAAASWSVCWAARGAGAVPVCRPVAVPEGWLPALTQVVPEDLLVHPFTGAVARRCEHAVYEVHLALLPHAAEVCKSHALRHMGRQACACGWGARAITAGWQAWAHLEALCPAAERNERAVKIMVYEGLNGVHAWRRSRSHACPPPTRLPYSFAAAGRSWACRRTCPAKTSTQPHCRLQHVRFDQLVVLHLCPPRTTTTNMSAGDASATVASSSGSAATPPGLVQVRLGTLRRPACPALTTDPLATPCTGARTAQPAGSIK